MKILHTEASPGWGGQELRILREAEGMRVRGHEVILAVQKGGGLVRPARDSGFLVYEIDFKKPKIFHIFFKLIHLIRKHRIDVLNTHSSLDAWIGGCAAKLCGCFSLRTRHLSTPVSDGLKSKILYNKLADFVVTTCEEAREGIMKRAQLSSDRCRSIPTGVEGSKIRFEPEEVAKFRKNLGVDRETCLAGTLCILRGWKGVADLLSAAALLRNEQNLKWLIVGAGASENEFKKQWKEQGLEDRVIFTGFLSSPYIALAAMDIFLLLSWANEGVSQASLQAAWLEKPLVTTPVGGLREVCIDQHTGYLVSPRNPEEVARSVMKLAGNKELRMHMGRSAKALVQKEFTLNHTLDAMEKVYYGCVKKAS